MAEVCQGIAAYRATEAPLLLAYYCTLLAEVSAHLGHPEDGLQALVEAHTLMEQQEERYWEAEVCRLRGVLLLRQPGASQAEAEACFQQALDVARRQEAKSLELRAAMSLARLLRDHGASLEEVILDERALARALQDEMDRLGEKIRVRWHNGSMPAFDIDDVAGQIDTALAPRIVLESGVEVLFEPGETLCAVDVDSATAGGRQGRAPRRPIDVNLEAAPAIAQQLRLRNIAGAVVIDFVNMRSTYDRDKVQAALADAMADDPVPTQLYGFTRLGHFELTRARRGATLAAQLEALEKGDD